MQEHTKRRLIDNRFDSVPVKILLYGPKQNESSLLKAAKNLGYKTKDCYSLERSILRIF